MTDLSTAPHSASEAWPADPASDDVGEMVAPSTAALTEPASTVLARIEPAGWRSLNDRIAPQEPRVAIDHLAIGPGGIFVIDSHSLAATSPEVSVISDPDLPTKLASAQAAADAIRALLPPLTRQCVVSVLTYADASPMSLSRGPVQICTTSMLPRLLDARRNVLTAREVTEVVATLETGLRQAGAAARKPPAAASPPSAAPQEVESDTSPTARSTKSAERRGRRFLGRRAGNPAADASAAAPAAPAQPLPTPPTATTPPPSQVELSDHDDAALLDYVRQLAEARNARSTRVAVDPRSAEPTSQAAPHEDLEQTSSVTGLGYDAALGYDDPFVPEPFEVEAEEAAARTATDDSGGIESVPPVADADPTPAADSVGSALASSVVTDANNAADAAAQLEAPIDPAVTSADATRRPALIEATELATDSTQPTTSIEATETSTAADEPAAAVVTTAATAGTDVGEPAEPRWEELAIDDLRNQAAATTTVAVEPGLTEEAATARPEAMPQASDMPVLPTRPPGARRKAPTKPWHRIVAPRENTADPSRFLSGADDASPAMTAVTASVVDVPEATAPDQPAMEVDEPLPDRASTEVDEAAPATQVGFAQADSESWQRANALEVTELPDPEPHIDSTPPRVDVVTDMSVIDHAPTANASPAVEPTSEPEADRADAGLVVAVSRWKAARGTAPKTPTTPELDDAAGVDIDTAPQSRKQTVIAAPSADVPQGLSSRGRKMYAAMNGGAGTATAADEEIEGRPRRKIVRKLVAVAAVAALLVVSSMHYTEISTWVSDHVNIPSLGSSDDDPGKGDKGPQRSKPGKSTADKNADSADKASGQGTKNATGDSQR